MHTQTARHSLTVRMKHGAFEFDYRSFVRVLLRKLKCELESAYSMSRCSSVNGCQATNTLSKDLATHHISRQMMTPTITSIPRGVVRTKNDSIPEHDAVTLGGTIDTLRRIVLQPFEISHQPLQPAFLQSYRQCCTVHVSRVLPFEQGWTY